ncbi:MAG: hypothetical protein QM740_17405 [Acidovorax sp.]
MTTNTSLSTVAIEIVNRHEQAAQTYARAYQSGVERMAERVANGLQSQQLPLVPESLKSSLISAQQQSAQLFINGAKARAAAVTALNENIAKGLRSGIERTASAAAQFDSATKGNLAQLLSQFILPSAQISLALANLLVQGAQRFETQAANDGVSDVAPKKQANA